MVDGISNNSYVAKLNEEEQKKKKTDEAKKTDSVSPTSSSEDDLQSLNLTSDEDFEGQIQTILQEIKLLEMELENIRLEEQLLSQQLDAKDIEDGAYEAKFSDISSRKNSVFNKISSKFNEINTVMQRAEISAQQKAAVQNVSGNYNFDNYDFNSGNLSLGGSEVGNASANFGLSFVGKINNDAQGNARFSPGGISQHWCADFVTTIIKETYAAKGQTLPKDFGSSSVRGLRDWGNKHGKYKETCKMSAKDRADYIAKNIKPGDIIIQLENGAGHTGIVTKVNPDGSFETVEGNSSDAVKKRSYPANCNKLSGFVRMS